MTWGDVLSSVGCAEYHSVFVLAEPFVFRLRVFLYFGDLCVFFVVCFGSAVLNRSFCTPSFFCCSIPCLCFSFHFLNIHL